MPDRDTGIRLYVEYDLAAGADVALDAKQAHYLRHVMRVKPGAALGLFNGRDGEWRGRVATLAKSGAAVAVESQTRAQAREPDLWLVFAPIKRSPIDLIAEKATELGVAAFQPVMTARTVVSRVNTDRLRANAVEAAEQCGRLCVPAVHEPRKFDRLLDAWPGDRRILLCDETGAGPPIASALADMRAREPTAGQKAWAVFIGPEGGYAPEELDALRKRPIVTPVTMGVRLLRADTAAIAALACWQALLGDWSTEP